MNYGHNMIIKILNIEIIEIKIEHLIIYLYWHPMITTFHKILIVMKQSCKYEGVLL
jgi:Mn2+/Fe2+ NRAMP family transporter